MMTISNRVKSEQKGGWMVTISLTYPPPPLRNQDKTPIKQNILVDLPNVVQTLPLVSSFIEVSHFPILDTKIQFTKAHDESESPLVASSIEVSHYPILDKKI